MAQDKIQYNLIYRESVLWTLDYVLWEKKNGITKLNIKTKLLIWFHLAVQNYSILVPT